MIDVPRNNGENIPIFRSMSRLISEDSVLSAQVKCYQLPPYDNSSTWEIQFSVFAINKGADQPARPLSLINAFVICLLESIIFILATSEISNLKVVSVAEQTGLGMALSKKIQRQVFLWYLW